MILWLNGPFGVGKSTTAQELTRRLSRARIFDPERVGWVLRRTVGAVRHLEDYQDLPLWRTTTIGLAGRSARTADPLVVPMTVLKEAYLRELLDGLREHGNDVRHVLLDASPEVLVDRIEAEGARDPRAWRMDNVGSYLSARRALRTFGDVIDTDDLNAGEVTDALEAIVRRPPAE